MEYELYHSGKKGMRWGVRLYQNKDGTLTELGKRRYRRKNLEDQKNSLDEEKTKVSGNNYVRKKTVSEMSDAELDRAINRAKKEDEYRRLRPEPQKPEKNAFAKQMLNDVIKPAAINSGRKLAQEAMDNLIKKITGDKVDPNSIEALKKTYEKLDYKQKIDKILNPDKYLNEEDKNKRQQREFADEEQQAKRAGYKGVYEKAAAEKAAAEKASAEKASADESARAANEATSNNYYEGPYSSKGGEKGYVNPNESRGLVPYSQSAGKSYTDNYSGWNNSYSSISNDIAVRTGSTRAASIIDKYGNEIFLPDDY